MIITNNYFNNPNYMYTCITDFLYNVGVISCKKQLWPIMNKDDYNKNSNGMTTGCNNCEL